MEAYDAKGNTWNSATPCRYSYRPISPFSDIIHSLEGFVHGEESYFSLTALRLKN